MNFYWLEMSADVFDRTKNSQRASEPDLLGPRFSNAIQLDCMKGAGLDQKQTTKKLLVICLSVVFHNVFYYYHPTADSN